MQAGSEEAFTVLYRHYSPRLYLNILGMIHDPLLAEEMVQELFTKIWQKREISGLQENFSGYIYRIAQHLVQDFFRKIKRELGEPGQTWPLEARMFFDGASMLPRRK